MDLNQCIIEYFSNYIFEIVVGDSFKCKNTCFYHLLNNCTKFPFNHHNGNQNLDCWMKQSLNKMLTWLLCSTTTIPALLVAVVKWSPRSFGWIKKAPCLSFLSFPAATKGFQLPFFSFACNLPAVFSIDFLGKLTGKTGNDNHVIVRHLAISCKCESVSQWLKCGHVTKGVQCLW